MGNYGRRKHPSENHNKNGLDNVYQTKLSYSNKHELTQSDAKDYLIPVLKEIGKAVFPAAAPLIEAAYQVFKHFDAIKEGASALSEGDYESAAQIAMKEVTKEAIGAYVSEKLTPTVDTCAEGAKEAVVNNIQIDDEKKNLVGKVVEGTIKGASEAVEDKVIDKIVQKVIPE